MGDTQEWVRMLNAARHSDPVSWGHLLEGQRGRLLLMAEQRLRGRVAVRVEAADVVQQTFLDAHRGLDQFQGGHEAAFAAWMEKILDHNIAHALRDHLQAQKRDLRREQSLDDSHGTGQPLGNQIDSGESTSSVKAMRHEHEQRLNQFLETLPADQREAWRLRHVEEWSLAQIAAHLGKTPVAAASLIKRGMQAVRKFLNVDQAQP